MAARKKASSRRHKQLQRTTEAPAFGSIVYLSVYPSEGPEYGGEWDTDVATATKTAREWQANGVAYIVEAQITGIVKRIPRPRSK